MGPGAARAKKKGGRKSAKPAAALELPADIFAALHADTGAGHNVVETVFVECMAEYRTDGPAELRPVGETEFVAGVAAESEAGDGATIAGVVGFADLTLGADVAAVLEAHVEVREVRTPLPWTMALCRRR